MLILVVLLSSLYILDPRPWLANIFSRLCFYFFDNALWCIKAFNLNQAQLSFVFLLSSYLEPIAKCNGVKIKLWFFFLGVLWFSSYILDVDPFWVDFCVQCETGVWLHSFARAFPVIQAPFFFLFKFAF
jgi:hypothetical protein